MQPFEGDEIARAKIREALGTNLGQYHYKDSNGLAKSIPAIWVVHDVDKDPPANHDVEGLECLIFPPLPRGDPLFSGYTLVEDDWLIRLIQHDRSASTRPGVIALWAVWPGTPVSYLEQSQELNQQANLTLKQWQVI